MDAECQAIVSVSIAHSKENKYRVNFRLISAEIFSVLRTSLCSLLSGTPTQRHSSKTSRMPGLISWLPPHYLISAVGR